MAVYRFRISFEEYDEIYRDIEIRSVHNFNQFHMAIQEAIGFDASKAASFFMSNDLWKKGQEIISGNENSVTGKILMKDARLCDHIADPHQKIYYVFDQPSQWTFFIELIKILPDGDPGKIYPACVKIQGEAPKQYLKIEPPKGIPDPEFIDEDIFSEILIDEEEPGTDDTETETSEDPVAGFGDSVDEEEYDNIEESTDDEIES